MDPIIFGKNDLSHIVAIEPKNGEMEIFQEINGQVTSQFVNHKYWLLSNQQVDNNWIRLQGDLYYKWAYQTNKFSDYHKYKSLKSKFDIYSVSDIPEAAMIKYGYTFFKDLKVSDVSILSFDIETTGLDPKADDAKLLLITNTIRKNGLITRKLFAFDSYSSEEEMITDWVNWVFEQDPTIICGHNIYAFDFPYIAYRYSLSGNDLQLGRNGSKLTFFKYDSGFRIDQTRDLTYKKIRCYGRQLVDTMFLAYKYDFAKKYSSYGLKSIIKEEGLEDKDRQHYDASTIRFNYNNPIEWAKIKVYAEKDADDSLKLFDLMAASTFYANRAVPKTFQSMVEGASGSQINSIMLRSYLQEGYSVPKATENNQFFGAISLGIPGIYKNVLKIDIQSLYPSIILQYNIYPENKDPKQNLLHITKYFTYERIANKNRFKETGDRYFDDLQNAEKIFINSIYGFLGSKGLNFNSPEHASKVTELGREILKTSIEWASSKNFDEIKNAAA